MILDSSPLTLTCTANKNHGRFKVMKYPAVMTGTTIAVSIASSSRGSKKKNKTMYRRNMGKKDSWKQQDKTKAVRYSSSSSVVIGFKKSLSYLNKVYNRKNGHWLMKEYELSRAILKKFDDDYTDYVLCAIKKRPVINTCPSETATSTMLNNASEITSNNLCRNLEHSEFIDN